MNTSIKKIISCVAAIACLCVNASAQTKITSSNYSNFGILDEDYSQYIGYYAITSSADLKGFANLVNGGSNTINGVVTTNINVAVADFTPIGTSTYPFRGTFERYSGTIQISASSETNTTSRSYQGLFGYNSGTIKSVQLALDKVTIYGTQYVGGIAGYNTGTITGCSVKLKNNSTGGIKGTSTTTYAGGIAGYNTGTIGDATKCTNNVSVIGVSVVGGIAGYNSGTVWGQNNGDVTGTGSSYVGGIVANNVGTVKSSTNNGNVTGAGYYVGGICGENNGASTVIDGCTNNGTIVGSSYKVGGICGQNYRGTIKTSAKNTGPVKGSYYVGGVCGYNSGSLTRGTSAADILIEATAANSYVGGICGYNYGKMVAATRQSSNSNVKGVTYVGGVVGYNASDTVELFSAANTDATVTSTASSGYSYCGGVAGYNAGTLTTVYNAATVTGAANCVGGIAGYNSENGVIASSITNYANVTGSQYVGGICGNNLGKIYDGTVRYYSSSYPLPVITATATGKAYVGGISGNNSGTIRLSNPSATISGSMVVGGIVGQNSGTISKCYDSDYGNCTITATTSSDTARCGGVCGVNQSTGTIDTCSCGGTVTGNRYVGGVCGDNAGTIRSGSFGSTITSSSGYAGGVCGNNSGTLTNCVSGSGSRTLGGTRSGGICGNNTGTISYCVFGEQPYGYYYQDPSSFGLSFNGQYSGGICGYNEGSLIGCHMGSTTVTSTTNYCGGICGYNTNIVSECTVAYSNISATQYVGGISGYNTGTISNGATTFGAITASGSSSVYAGGIAGRNYGGTVSYCYSTVSVTQTGSSSSSYIGGLVGSNSTGSKIEYSYSQGDVTAKGNYCGGLTGYNGAQITNTYAYGAVKSVGYYVGGLIGQQYSGTITNSYYLADVAADGNNTVQNGCGASSKGSTVADPSGVNKKSFYSFGSGEVCYLLNGSVNGGSPWGQNIALNVGGTPDKAPILETTNLLVYKITGTNISLYSNDANYEIPSGIAEKLANFEGDGSLENPFLIPDLQHLEDFREIVKAGYRRACGKLTADIVINESVVDENGELRSDYRSAQLKTWIPIDDYQGCFDGNNHTIKGLFCMDVEGEKGLFADIQSAEIKNLTLADGYIKTSNYAGGICTKAINSRIFNCHNSCSIITDGGMPYSGGMCGNSENSVIEKCSNTASVINTRINEWVYWVGGIVGSLDKGSVVRECYNTGEIVGSYGCGGIAGMSQSGNNLIERCYNTGLIRGNGYSNDFIGGIVGSMNNKDIVRNCYNTGNIMGVRVGGIVAHASGTVEYCYNAGTINGTTKGAIAGWKDDGSSVTRNYYDKTVCGDAGGVNGVELSNQAYGHTTTEMCNSTLSTALNSYYDASIWQAGTTANASTEVITDDNVFGYKIIGTYPSLKGVGEPQYAKTLWVNIGTEESPQWISDFIPIYTIAQLKAISDNLDATYVLMNNVSEGANIKNGELVPSPTISWTPINHFTGKFYGLGHTISGLYTESSDEYVGLFSVTEGAMIKGVKIANSSFKTTNNNGVAGGIAGEAGASYINGVLSYSKIIDCDNVSCTVEAKYEAGGIVGVAGLGCSYIEYCRNYGTVISNFAGQTNYAGGICGAAWATIRYCYNEGTVSGVGANVGGIGGGPMAVRNCYNVGTLSGGNVGGIAGSDGLGTDVYNSYSAGQLSASGSVGSIIGMVGLGAYSTNSYYDVQVSPFDGISGSMDREGKVESKTTDELCLELQSGLSSDDWAIKEPVIKDGKKYLYYPYLKHFGEKSAKVGTYRQICNVVLNQNGGTCTPLTQYIEREGATLPATASRTGYTFGGWYTNASCTSERAYEIPVTATGEQTFYAKWTANSYSITLNTNGGVINSGNVTTYTYGNSVMLPTDISKTGYTFGGWYTNSSFSGSSVQSISSTDTGNKTYYARWTVNTYAVTFVTNNGTINAGNITQYKYGDGATLPTNVTKTGNSFAGWYTNDSYAGERITSILTTATGDKTFYAKWDVNSYNVTFDTKGGTINNGNVTSYTYGVGATLPTDVTKIGCSFAGWYDNSGYTGSVQTSIPVNSLNDKKFWAKWDTINYTITYNANEGEFAVAPVNSYRYGDEVVLATPTRAGHTFAGWYNNSNLVGTEFSEIESTEFGNKEFWAKWEVNSYDVTLDVDGGDINSGNVASYTYNVLTILPQDVTKVGHTFEGWFDSENQKVTQISKGTIGDVTFTAHWTAKTYSVTLQTNNGTINAGNVTSYTFGTAVTLPTKEQIIKTGYEFLGWYDNSSYDGGEVNEIADNEIGNKNFWARWTAASYEVTLDAAGGTINSNAIERYTDGVGAVLPTDVTKIGYMFKGWKDEDDEDALEITTADYGDKTFTAQWEEANYSITYDAKGGSINEEYVSTYNYNVGEITLPTDVTKEGNEFGGWYDNPNFTGERVTVIPQTSYGDKTFYAKWNANTYDVTFETKGGTINSGAFDKYTYGEVASLPTNVTKDGYTFTGWYIDEDCEGDVISIISSTSTGDKTFYAGWSNTAYAVTLYTNDGIISSGNVTAYTFGSEVQLPTKEQISKTGYTFGGWYDNASCTGDSVLSVSSTATGDKQFWAKWKVQSYLITFETDGGTVNSGNVKNYIYGTTVVLPSDVTKTGYTFEGWYDNESCSGSAVLSVSSNDLGDKTFYAKWLVNSYDITFVTNEGTINVGELSSYTYGVGATLPTDVTKTGYTFDGWFTNTSYIGSSVSSVLPTETGNKTFYAKWSVKSYAVTLNANGGTITNGEIDSYTYGVGATLPIAKNVVKTGYTFNGWYDNDEFAGESVTAIANNAVGEKAFYAKWIINTYDVTLNANGGTINAGEISKYEFGTGATLPNAVTKEGYTFIGWYDNANLTGEAFTAIANNVTGDKTFYARYTVNTYTVNLVTNGGTINNGNVTNYTYGVGATLPADVTKTGYAFKGWYDNDEFAGEAITTVANNETGDKTFFAKFTVNTYNVILVTNEGVINAGNVESYEFGKGATLPTDVTKEGYSFDGWYSNSSYIGGSVSSIAGNDMGDKQFWAKWTIKEYEVTATAENGTVEGTRSYEYKSTAILKAIANDGYEFVGWNDNTLTDARIQFVVTKDTTLTANFKEKEKVQIAGTLE
ncbi:MAG: InlB B-repeat-containing protein, partial [Bacteroidales bacterium]|nr:InlB B-repeat-containing protein [Bacteroidales bacterium]